MSARIFVNEGTKTLLEERIAAGKIIGMSFRHLSSCDVGMQHESALAMEMQYAR